MLDIQPPIRLQYASKKRQFGDLYLPSTAGPHTVIILIHGGFWHTPYDYTLMNGLAKDLVKRGFAVWNIEYRRVGDTQGGWPWTLLDVARAADHLYTIAPAYQLDLAQVFAIGHSAGGHLALWLAARHKIPADNILAQTYSQEITRPLSLAGAISLAGVSDLELGCRRNLGSGAVMELLGGSLTEVPEHYNVASPASLLPLGIPQILIHGTEDDRVPLDMSQLYACKATEAGDSIEIIELPGVDHFALIDASSSAWNTAVQALQRLMHRSQS